MTTSSDREEVATFAAWCVGSCHGDDDPRVEAERQRVLKDNYAFGWWAAESERYSQNRRTGQPAAFSDGPFIHAAKE